MSLGMIIAAILLKTYKIFRKSIMMLGKSRGALFTFYVSGMSLVLISAPMIIKMMHTYRMMQSNSKGDLFTSIFLECLLV